MNSESDAIEEEWFNEELVDLDDDFDEEDEPKTLKRPPKEFWQIVDLLDANQVGNVTTADNLTPLIAREIKTLLERHRPLQIHRRQYVGTEFSVGLRLGIFDVQVSDASEEGLESAIAALSSFKIPQTTITRWQSLAQRQAKHQEKVSAPVCSIH